MHKYFIASLLLLININSYAYQIYLDTHQLNPQELLSIELESVKGSCQIINGQYNCERNKTNLEGLPVEHVKPFFEALNSANKTERLIKFNLKINNHSFSSCQNLERRGQVLSIVLTPQACL